MKLSNSLFLVLIVATVGACGDDSSTTPVDPMLEAPLKGNGTKTGGYLWTYTDSIPGPLAADVATAAGITAGSEFPTTVTPLSSLTVPFVLSDPTTHGLPAAPGGSKAACIHYHIPPAPTFSAIPTPWTFKDSSGGPAYPTAGLGFSWKDKNVPFDVDTYSTGGKTGIIGIRFTAAAGDFTANHPFAVQFPDTHTDVSVVAEGDKFTTSCTCKSGSAGSPAAPYCVPATTTINGAVTVATGSLNSCFAFWRYNFQPADTNWHEYTVLFTDLAPGDQITAPPTAPAYPWADNTIPFDHANALKVQFAMFQPTAEPSVENDFCVGSVDFVMQGDTCVTGVDNCGGD